MIIPICEKIFNVCPNNFSDSNAPAMASGTVSMMMSGSIKLSNCAAKMRKIKTNAKIKAKLEKESKNEIGFLAQELKDVFPEIVFLDSTNNLYSVNYSRLIPVLVEAMKEQNAHIMDLEYRLSQIELCLGELNLCGESKPAPERPRQTAPWPEAGLCRFWPSAPRSCKKE